jgi:AbrB family looped-hinge helix DNA binding protein
VNSSISSKGQVTVPKQVRDRLGLRPGTVVEFEFTDDGVVMRKGHKGERPVDRVRGVLRDVVNTDDFIDTMRGPRPKPEKRR